MNVKVKIPNVLQKLTNGVLDVQVEAGSVSGMIEALESKYPGIRERLCDEGGRVRRFINIFRNGEDIRFLEMEETSLEEGDEISIIPAIAGGGR